MNNGTENVNQMMTDTLETLNVSYINMSFYHLQEKSKVEQFHRTLHDIVSKKMGEHPKRWDLHLSQVLAVIKFNMKESTKFSPFHVRWNLHLSHILAAIKFNINESTKFSLPTFYIIVAQYYQLIIFSSPEESIKRTTQIGIKK